MTPIAWNAASFMLLVSMVKCFHSSSYVPEGYAYIGHSFQEDVLASVVGKHETKLSTPLTLRTNGHRAFLEKDASKQGALLQQRSVDKQHETVMVTREGHVYTKQLALPNSAKQTSQPATSKFPPMVPKGRKRSLLPTNDDALLDRLLDCDGCPTTDARVSVNDSTQHPWNTVGFIRRAGFVIGPDLDSVLRSDSPYEEEDCTGTLIGQNHVLTAAHCVVNGTYPKLIHDMAFWPARNKVTGSQSPRIMVSRSRMLSIFHQASEPLNYDFALLTLQDPVLSGPTELAIRPGAGYQIYNLTTAGYPGDKDRGTMWTTNCTGVHINFDSDDLFGCGEQCDNMMQHSCPTYDGQSGSSMWSGVNQTIHAIVTGRIIIDGYEANVGIKLNNFVYNVISAWYNEDKAEYLSFQPTTAPAPASIVDGITYTWDRDIKDLESLYLKIDTYYKSLLPGSAPALAPAPASMSAPAPARFL